MKLKCRSQSLSSKNAFEALQEQNFCNSFTTTTTRVSTTTQTVTPFFPFYPPSYPLTGTEVNYTSTESSTKTGHTSTYKRSTPDKRSISTTSASSVTVTESTTPNSSPILNLSTSSIILTESTKPGVSSVSTADYSSKSKNDNYIFDTGSPYKNDMRNGYLMLRF